MEKLTKKLGMLLGVVLTIAVVVWLGNKIIVDPPTIQMSPFDFSKHIQGRISKLKQPLASLDDARNEYRAIKGEIQTERFAGAIDRSVADDLYNGAYDAYTPKFVAYADYILSDTVYVWAANDVDGIYNEAVWLGGSSPDVSRIRSTVESYRAVLALVKSSETCKTKNEADAVAMSAAKFKGSHLPVGTRQRLGNAPDKAMQSAYSHVDARCDDLIANASAFKFAADFEQKADPIIVEARKFNDETINRKIVQINNIIEKKKNAN